MHAHMCVCMHTFVCVCVCGFMWVFVFVCVCAHNTTLFTVPSASITQVHRQASATQSFTGTQTPQLCLELHVCMCLCMSVGNRAHMNSYLNVHFVPSLQGPATNKRLKSSFISQVCVCVCVCACVCVCVCVSS